MLSHPIKRKQDRGLAKSLLTENKQIADTMPINSIVAEIIGINSFVDDSVQRGQVVACIPLFSSHISMPLKSGEAVWLISFQEKNSQNFNYFWISPYQNLKFQASMPVSFQVPAAKCLGRIREAQTISGYV